MGTNKKDIMMEFYKDQVNGYFILTCDGNGLIMSREEAETLFVSIGHVLQDDDIDRYDESGETEEQPDMYSHGHSVERFTDG